MKKLFFSFIKKMFPEKTEDQLWEQLKQLHLNFSAYLRYQHTLAGYEAALLERDYSRSIIQNIWAMPSGEKRLNEINEHIQYLKIINRRGPQ